MAYTVKVGVQRLDLTDRPSLTPMQVWKSGRCIWILQATSPQVLLNKNYSSTRFLEKFISTEFVKNILKYITSGHLWALPKIVYIFNIFFFGIGWTLLACIGIKQSVLTALHPKSNPISARGNHSTNYISENKREFLHRIPRAPFPTIPSYSFWNQGTRREINAVRVLADKKNLIK